MGGPLPGWSSLVAEPAGIDVTRFLRPGQLVRSGGVTWLVDESWPVVAALGDDGSTSLLAWPWQQAQISAELDHVAVADGVGIVVRDGEQFAWVRPDGNQLAQVDGKLSLAAADADTAWFVDRTDVDTGRPPAPPPPLSPGRIVAVHRDGSRTQVDTPTPVKALGIRGTDVWVRLSEAPSSHPTDYGSWTYSYPSTVLRVSRDALLADGLATAVAATGDVPATPFPRPSAWVGLMDDPAMILRYGQRAGGLVWWAGAPYGGDPVERQVVVVGHDRTTGRPSVRVELGGGLVRDVQTIGDELWLSVARRRYLAVSRDRGVDVVAVAASGVVRTIHSADSIDISRFAPAAHRPPPEQIREHIDEVRHRFDYLDRYWRAEDGTTSPLSVGLSDPLVSVDGEWPDTRIVITLRHPRRPGLLLRRTLPLFDQTGSPIKHEHADIHLMEDLDTGHLASAGEALDGVLDT